MERHIERTEIPLLREDVAMLGRRATEREKLERLVVQIPASVLEQIEEGAHALDYQTSDFVRAILRWAVSHAVIVTSRGRYHFAEEADRVAALSSR